MYKGKGLSGLLSSEFEISNTIMKTERSPGATSNQDKVTCIDLVSPGLLKMQPQTH